MMDRRVTLQEPSESQDSTYGETTITFSDVGKLWAERAYMDQTSEDIYQGRIESSQMALYRFWYEDAKDLAVDRGFRILDDGDTYEVHGAREVGRREKMEVVATRVRV